MQVQKKYNEWFGVPRKEIKWYPMIDPGQCIGCGLCAAVCGRGVYKYDFEAQRPIVVYPYNCLVGCQTCANLCPVGAIEFPKPETLKKYIAKYKIFIKVKELLKRKFSPKETEEYKKQMDYIESAERKIIADKNNGHET
ncbi:MAG: 4Fe-4S dicluster domain-containing protein [Candidatus Njordarchaeia archaeon]